MATNRHPSSTDQVGGVSVPLCPECRTQADRWLDSRPARPPFPIVQIGRPNERHVIESRARRADDHYSLVRAQIHAIKQTCLTQHQETQ